MMDYYEELGVEQSASADEIHLAYKHLARLLHPDLCGDEQVRRLADLQMKRLNGMLHVLTTPEDRENYDRSLSARQAEPSGAPRSLDWRAPKWLWPVLGAILLAGVISLLNRSPRPVVTPASTRDRSAEQAVSPPKPRASRTRPHDRRAREPAAEGLEVGDIQVDQAPARPRDPATAGSAAEPIFEEPAAAHSIAAPTAKPATTPGLLPARPSLAGNWLFVPAPDSKPAGLYPPEYIELRVAEDAGVLRGRYRARYRVTDKAISPTVVFEFEGPGSNVEARLPWTGSGGARGEVTMRLLEGGALEVIWEAHRMGAGLGLISGTATLVRRLD